jgi:hypothetical protein
MKITANRQEQRRFVSMLAGFGLSWSWLVLAHLGLGFADPMAMNSPPALDPDALAWRQERRSTMNQAG